MISTASMCIMGWVSCPQKLSLINKYINWKGKFKIFSQFYLDDIPNALAFDAESEFWETHQGPCQQGVGTILKTLRFDLFEIVKAALYILATSPRNWTWCPWSYFEICARQSKIGLVITFIVAWLEYLLSL